MPEEDTRHHVSRAVVARALSIDGMTGEVALEFDRAGVRTLLLKGPALATWLYDEGMPRGYADCDLLVPPEDYSAAGRVLASLGFERSDQADHLEPEFGPMHADTWRRGDGDEVDLHRALPGMRMGGSDVWGAMSDGAERLKVGRATIPIPPPAGRALVVALHAAHHGHEQERPLEDLRRAVERVPVSTWEETRRLAERLHSLPRLAIGLRLVPGGEALAERLGLPSEELLSAALGEGARAEVALGFERLAHARGVRAKASLLLSEMFPSPRFMRWWTPLARRGPVGLALAYPWRIVYLLRQAVPGIRAWRRARLSSARS